jgi:CRP/FNR family transcriptional regulator
MMAVAADEAIATRALSMDQAKFHPLYGAGCAVVCSSCNLREICLPVGMNKAELDQVDRLLVAHRRRVQQGDSLYRPAEAFDAVYAVRAGFFKTVRLAGDGREQVTGFHMSGELLGLDGIGSGQHEAHAVALEDSQVCVVPFAGLERLSLALPSLQHELHRVMSREIVHKEDVMLLLGTRHAEARVSAFLLNLTHRLQARGFSPSSLVLRMTRQEIGSYLGLTLETVSRTFSKFQAAGLLHVRSRHIRITDAVGLHELLEGAEP